MTSSAMPSARPGPAPPVARSSATVASTSACERLQMTRSAPSAARIARDRAADPAGRTTHQDRAAAQSEVHVRLRPGSAARTAARWPRRPSPRGPSRRAARCRHDRAAARRMASRRAGGSMRASARGRSPGSPGAGSCRSANTASPANRYVRSPPVTRYDDVAGAVAGGRDRADRQAPHGPRVAVGERIVDRARRVRVARGVEPERGRCAELRGRAVGGGEGRRDLARCRHGAARASSR